MTWTHWGQVCCWMIIYIAIMPGSGTEAILHQFKSQQKLHFAAFWVVQCNERRVSCFASKIQLNHVLLATACHQYVAIIRHSKIFDRNWNWFELMQNGSRRDGGGFVWPIGTNRADYVCGQSRLLTLDRCEYYLLRVACCSIAPPW